MKDLIESELALAKVSKQFDIGVNIVLGIVATGITASLLALVMILTGH